MELLTAVFSRLLSMALTALPVTAVVLAVRLALCRAPRKYSYALWLAVGFRLVCPVSFERLWSIFELPGLYDLAESTGAVGTGAVNALPPVAAALSPAPSVTAPAAVGGTVTIPAVPVEGAAQVIPLLSDPDAISWSQLLPQIGAAVWLLGVLALLAVGIVSLVRLRRRLAGAVWQGGQVWESENVPTPFVLGFFRPRIYLPPGLSGTERTCVLVHERHHIRRGDPWWKLLGWCVLAVYWWDPAVWLCWVLFCRDMEMSCDEAVLATLGDQTKTGYSEALVSFALARRVPAALAFGEHDAARRVKHVLNWKRETPRIAFLAFAAVFLAVTACISNPALRPDSGFVWGVEGEDGAWSLEYQFPDDTRSFVFYQEVYRYGELEDRSCLVLDGMEETGEGVTKREGAFPLEVFREEDKTGVRFSSGTFPALLAEAADNTLLTEWSCLRGKTDLNLGGSAAVAVAYAPGEGTPPLECGDLNREEAATLLRQYPVAVVLRLTVSRGLLMNLSLRVDGGTIDLPAVLYALRLDRALEGDLPALPLGETLDQDLSGVRAILETLGVPDLDRCTLELGADPLHEGTGTLRVWCEAPTDQAAFETAMNTASLLVPALVGDVDQVTYGSGSGDGRTWHTLYTKDGTNSLDGIARELCYRDIHALGQTLAGVQALADWAWEWDLPSLSAADTLARRLWPLREAGGTELETLLLDEGIPGVNGAPAWVPVNHRSVTRPDEHTLSFRFDDPAPTAAEVQRAMEKKAVVLLAMREELTQVTWTWTPVSGGGLSGQMTEAEADALLAAAGFTGGAKAMGASPAALAQLLSWLESRTLSLTVEGLYALTRDAGPETAAEELVCRGPWAASGLDGTFTVSLEGDHLYLQFSQEDAWESALSMHSSSAMNCRLACDAVLLLALYPQLQEVRAWSPDRQSYLWVTPETVARSLPEGRSIRDYGVSPEALEELTALLERLGGSNRTAAADAASLLDRARSTDPVTLAGEVLASPRFGTARWTGCALELLEDGALRGAVSGLSLADGDWLDQRSLLERCGMLLLALEPELPQVWWRDSAGAWDLVLDRTRTDNYLMEFLGPETRLDSLSGSTEALAEFLTFLPAADMATAAAARTEPFENVLGYDGTVVTEYASYGFRSRSWCVPAGDGGWTAIARSFGYGEPEAYAVDLDGDGAEELVCNVTFGADGGRNAYVYQRRSDGVYLGTHSAEGLPDFFNWGGNASWSEYDPAENCFRLHYCVEEGAPYAQVTYRGMDGLTFAPCTDPYAAYRVPWVQAGT